MISWNNLRRCPRRFLLSAACLWKPPALLKVFEWSSRPQGCLRRKISEPRGIDSSDKLHHLHWWGNDPRWNWACPPIIYHCQMQRHDRGTGSYRQWFRPKCLPKGETWQTTYRSDSHEENLHGDQGFWWHSQRIPRRDWAAARNRPMHLQCSFSGYGYHIGL